MEFPHDAMLEVLDDRASVASASCTADAGRYSRLELALKAYYRERFETDQEFREMLLRDYPDLAGEFEQVRKAG